MKKGEWTRFPYSEQPDTPELSPIKYSLPFEWGTVQVTEAADYAYGLVPLTADKVKGSIANGESLDPHTPAVDIFIVAPSELPSDVQIRGNLWALIRQHKNGISLTMGQTETTEQIQKLILEAIEAGEDIPEIQDFLEFLEENDIPPLPELVEQNVPQQIVHSFTGVIDRTVAEGSSSWIRGNVNQDIYRQVRRIGAVGLLGTVYIGAIDMLPDGRIDPLPAGIAVGWLGGHLLLTMRTIKQTLANYDTSEVLVEASGKMMGTLVAADFHAKYCTTHFDREHSSLFEDGEDEETVEE